MKTEVEKLPNNVYKVKVTDSKEVVDKAYKEALEHEAQHVEVKGFRKGQAPLDLVKKQVDMGKLRGHALNHLLPKIYEEVQNQYKYKPIVQPRFNIIKFEEGEDLEIEIIFVEMPEIKIGDYKKALTSTYEKVNQGKESKTKLTNQQIVDILLQNSEVGVPDVLIDEETDRMMTSLIDQTAKLGITVDEYLKSINKTADDLRKDYRKSAEATLKGEFVVTEISKELGVEVTDTEIDQTIAAVPDEKSREILNQPDQRLYIKAILMKNKTLEQLSDMAEKGSKKDKDSKKDVDTKNKSKKDDNAKKEEKKEKTTKKETSKKKDAKSKKSK